MRFAFALARSRPRKLLTVVTKSNAQRHGMVMWDEIAAEVAKEFPDVTWDKMLVDAMTMRMTLKPETLDTIVATNLHADILSDLAAALAGSLGIAPTANLNPERTSPSMFEPIHGSAFDITGKGIANPVGTFWTGVMMLEHLGEKDAAARLMRAVERVTADPALHTPDLGGTATTRAGDRRRLSRRCAATISSGIRPEHARAALNQPHQGIRSMHRFTTSLLASALLASTTASAQTAYPDRPITVLVPHAAGGPTDTVSRLVAELMTGTLGQQVLVENAGGAGSTLGTARAARAEPDGYTLLLNHVAQASSATLYRKLAYDPDGAFDGIGRITDVPMTIVARADFEPGTIGELIEYIRANKDTVTYAHAGVGSASHLCGMLFMDAIDVPLITVPYKGTGPAMTDLLGGQVDVMCDQTTNTINQIKTGKIKGYAVTTKERLAVLPDLPTLDESGLEGFEMTVWHGLYAPAGTPAGGDRQAVRGAAGGGAGSEGDRALRRSRHGPGAARAGHAGGDGRAARGRDRQVEADHRGGRRLRRLSSGTSHLALPAQGLTFAQISGQRCGHRRDVYLPRRSLGEQGAVCVCALDRPTAWGLSRVRGWPTMTGTASSRPWATSSSPAPPSPTSTILAPS